MLHRDAGSPESEDVKLQAQRAEILASAALLKVRRNATAQEWTVYKTFLVDEATKANAAAGKQLAAKMDSVNNQFLAFQREIEIKEAAVKKALPEPTSVWGPGDLHFYEEEIETIARNRLYEERLIKVKDLRLYYQVLKAKAQKTPTDQQTMYKLALAVTEAIPEALYFANEVYATEGATQHAVVGIQMVNKTNPRREADISKEKYLQSFLENVGDSLHSLEHYKGDPSYASYRAGKYMFRMLLAARALALPTTDQAYPVLDKVAQASDKLKQTDQGDDPIAIQADPFFKTETQTDLNVLRLAVLRYARLAPNPFPAPASEPSKGAPTTPIKK